jgi:uncharacterized protein (DUF4415 family)
MTSENCRRKIGASRHHVLGAGRSAKERCWECSRTEEIDALLARGESGTDWGAVKGTTAQELEASIATDPGDVHEPIGWTRAVRGLPPRKPEIHIRIDEDVFDWFRHAGRCYQSRINDVLRALYGEPKACAALVLRST